MKDWLLLVIVIGVWYLLQAYILPKMGVSLRETEQGLIMRSSTSDLAWMSRVLAGLSFPFVVREPPELREALRCLAAEIVALAERTEGSGSDA